MSNEPKSTKAKTKAADPRSAPSIGKGPAPAVATLVGELAAAWRAIQRHCPEVPDVVVYVGSGVEGRKLAKHGHYLPDAWIRRDEVGKADAVRLPEVVIASETLNRPADQVFATLLHEAAHGLACARGDANGGTSRQGRYHNERFKDAASELGLVVERDDQHGWCRTSLALTTAARFATSISQIAGAVPGYRAAYPGAVVPTTGTDGDDAGEAEGDADEAPTKRSTGYPAHVCACEEPRRIRCAVATLLEGPIKCGRCGAPFASLTLVDAMTEALEADELDPLWWELADELGAVSGEAPDYELDVAALFAAHGFAVARPAPAGELVRVAARDAVSYPQPVDALDGVELGNAAAVLANLEALAEHEVAAGLPGLANTIRARLRADGGAGYWLRTSAHTEADVERVRRGLAAEHGIDWLGGGVLRSTGKLPTDPDLLARVRAMQKAAQAADAVAYFARPRRRLARRARLRGELRAARLDRSLLRRRQPRRRRRARVSRARRAHAGRLDPPGRLGA
jgi:hypothetical protein